KTVNQIAKSLKSRNKRINQRFFDPSIWFPISLLMKTLLASVYSRPDRATAKYFAMHAARRE
ncbi:hypothetical protein, partial [Gluconobacter kondonii]|uniref:hypothetical protein n=1 Tax=Gluconobacter kondonii TaxID=941463 RepID=UPI001B8B4F89